MSTSLDNTFVLDQIKAIAGVTPILVSDYDLLKIEPSERLQVRIDKNSAPREMVDRFRFQMSDTAFPPIVVTEDAKIIDGNTRYKARIAREEIKGSVLVVPINWETADEENQHRLLLLGLALNNVNGKPLDEEERARMVRHAIKVGLSNVQIMFRIGIAERTVRALRAELDAKQRLAQVGLSVEPTVDAKGETVDPVKLGPAVVRALGKEEIVKLDDGAFHGLAVLAADAGYKANEVKALAATLRGLETPESRSERIAREREALALRIATVARGGDAHPSRSRQLRKALAMLVDGDDPADAFVERNVEEMHEHVRVLQIATAVIGRILDLQAVTMPTAGAGE